MSVIHLHKQGLGTGYRVGGRVGGRVRGRVRVRFTFPLPLFWVQLFLHPFVREMFGLLVVSFRIAVAKKTVNVTDDTNQYTAHVY